MPCQQLLQLLRPPDRHCLSFIALVLLLLLHTASSRELSQQAAQQPPTTPSTTLASASHQPGTRRARMLLPADQQQGTSNLTPALSLANVSAMRADVFNFWLQHGPDKQYGGFYGTLDRQGAAMEPTSKTIVQQGQHLWTFSTLLMVLAEQPGAAPAAAVRSAADSLFNFMRKNMALRLMPDDIPPALADRAGNATGGTAFVYEVYKEGANTRQGINVANSAVNVMANAFAILGLARYAEATNSSDALRLAVSTFETIDALYHAPETGGYDESNTIGGLVFDSVPLATNRTNSGTGSDARPGNQVAAGPVAGERRSQSSSTLIHMTDALQELSRATAGANPTVQSRLLELLQLLTGPMVVQGAMVAQALGQGPNQQQGQTLNLNSTTADGSSQGSGPPLKSFSYLATAYDPKGWRPVGIVGAVSFGVNIGASWMLAGAVDQLAAGGTISQVTSVAMKAVLRDIGITAVQLGYDNANGGLNEKGSLSGQLGSQAPKTAADSAAVSASSTNKVFWVQANALAGLNWLYRQAAAAGLQQEQQQYRDKLFATWDFVVRNLWDRQFGEWFWQVGPAGGPSLAYEAGGQQFASGVKGNWWKSSFHVGRALLWLEGWIS